MLRATTLAMLAALGLAVSINGAIREEDPSVKQIREMYDDVICYYKKAADEKAACFQERDREIKKQQARLEEQKK